MDTGKPSFYLQNNIWVILKEYDYGTDKNYHLDFGNVKITVFIKESFMQILEDNVLYSFMSSYIEDSSVALLTYLERKYKYEKSKLSTKTTN